MNPAILVAIIIQALIARASRIAGAIAGYIITTGVLIWGLSVYDEGNAIAFFGARLSQGVFVLLCLVWYGFDTWEFIKARSATKTVGALIVTTDEKIPLSSLEDLNSAIGKKAFRADDKTYLGQITGVDKNFSTCRIKSDLGQEVTKPIAEIEFQPEEQIKEEQESIAELPCKKCNHFDSRLGVCSYLHFNVISYPEKYIKKCNGKYFSQIK